MQIDLLKAKVSLVHIISHLVTVLVINEDNKALWTIYIHTAVSDLYL